MIRRTLPVVLLAVLLTTAFADARPRLVKKPDDPPPRDFFSAAETADVRSLHLDIDLLVDFEKRQLRGSVIHTIVNYRGTDRFVVDTRDLTIQGVSIDGRDTTWTLGPRTGSGRALTIDILPSTRTVEIDYETDPGVEGLNWLTPLQTLGDEEPFLFTLVQPDRTRDWIPVQDTPGVRTTYEATIRVPPGLLAVMSAKNPTEISPDGTYHFEMPYPVPSYLIAIAAGLLEFHPLDERTGIYVEPSIADEALWDLQYIPEMVDRSEEILGPYPFERYDILLVPPGFAAGGMENPMLNFINVMSVVDGDFEPSPVPQNVMAHELAHSWAGDLVTCGTWDDTWLNEGSATYYSSRILETMSGVERAELGYYWNRLKYEGYIEQTEDSPEAQILHREFQPGESLAIFSPTSYDKGSLFLKTLEDVMGRDTFDEFARSYFRRYALRWVDDQSFLDHLSSFVTGDAPLHLDEWVYDTGLPSNVTAPERSAIWDRIGVEASRFRSGVPASRLDTEDWTRFDHNLFLWQITDAISPRIVELDAAFGYSALKSPSIHWFIAVARTLYGPGLPMLDRYLTLGSWNAISIYRTLSESSEGRKWAIQQYERARAQYTPAIRANIDQILGFETSSLRPAA